MLINSYNPLSQFSLYYKFKYKENLLVYNNIMDCKRCGRKRCTMPSVILQLCQVCYNYTPEKSCTTILQDFLQSDVPKIDLLETPDESISKPRQ